jgi:hypothetical protein
MLLGVVAVAPPSSAVNTPTIVVGRIYAIEGDLLRYVPEESDWVAVARDAPFGEEDTLFSGSRGMAELVAPNGSWIRVGNSTQIQFIALDTHLSEMDVATGMARFYNKGSYTVFKVTSPFGYVLADPGAVFDFYVGENSAEVVPIRGAVSFIHAATNARYGVTAGSPSILADQDQVSSGEGTVDPDWDRWNRARENIWAAKARVRGRSAQYLPPSLQDESYALEENGRWESVPYEGASRWFWRPTTVAAGWAPFTMGRWTEWGGDQCWIPDEPFGYVTHHYGNWIYARRAWYWAPPVASVRVGLPLLNLGFFWYPGRVSWIHSGRNVGWVPLAPQETYYSHRNWGGPHAMVVNTLNITRIDLNIRNYAYANHAIVVPQKNFSRVNNYRDVRVTNINPTTIINSYRAEPVVSNTVINNYTTDKQRFNYTNATVNEKPHNTVINRIQRNETVIRGGRKESADVLDQQVKKLPEGKINHEARIEQPKATNYIVPVNEVNRPKAEIKLRQREIKAPGGTAPQVQPAQSAQSPAKPGPAAAVKPPATETSPGQPTVKPEQVKPKEHPGQGSQSAQPAQPTGKPVLPEQAVPLQHPAVKPERVRAAVPEQPAAGPKKPAGKQPEQVKPKQRPEQGPEPTQPGVKPQRVAPTKIETTGTEPGEPLVKPEQVKPKERPEQRPQPARKVAKPERVAPGKPGHPDKAEDEPEQQEKRR